MANSYIKSKKTDLDISHIIKRSMRDFGERQTDKYIAGLEETLQKIGDSPQRGWELISNQHYSYYPYVSHVIYYRKRKKDVFIARILHKKMLPEKYL